MIESIKKVKVMEITPIQPLTREAAEAQGHEFGVYLLFRPIEGKDPSSSRATNRP